MTPYRASPPEKVLPPDEALARHMMVLWVVPFVLIGLYLLIGRQLVHARTRASTFYGLTEQDVLVLRGRELQEFPLADLDRERMALDFRGRGYTDIWLRSPRNSGFCTLDDGGRNDHHGGLPRGLL